MWPWRTFQNLYVVDELQYLLLIFFVWISVSTYFIKNLFFVELSYCWLQSPQKQFKFIWIFNIHQRYLHTFSSRTTQNLTIKIISPNDVRLQVTITRTWKPMTSAQAITQHSIPTRICEDVSAFTWNITITLETPKAISVHTGCLSNRIEGCSERFPHRATCGEMCGFNSIPLN